MIRPTIAVLGALGFAALVGCRGQASQDSPIVGIRGMYDQPRYDVQAKSDFFADKRTMRLPVDNTVAREAELDPELSTGRLADNTGYVLAVPKLALDRAGAPPGANEEAKRTALLARGQERFNIYCAPCHDMTGSGHGIIVKHGMLPPPTFHQDRIRHLPDGQIFATISNGIRNMPAYGINVPVQDRWAIVSYIRALELSQAPIASSKESQL